MIDDDDKEIEKANALFDRGEELYNNQEYIGAKDIFSTILDKYTEYFEEWNIHEWLGLCYYWLDEYGAALFHLQKALAMYKDSDDALGYLIILQKIACSYYHLYEYAQSMDYFDKASKYVNLYIDTERINELYIYHLIRGRCCLFLQRFNDAENEFITIKTFLEQITDTREYDEDLNLLNYELGRTYVYLRELDKAELFLKKVSVNDLDEPIRSSYHFHLGKLFYLKKEYIQALKEFLECEKLGIRELDKAEEFCFIGMSYCHTGDNANAKTYLTNALKYPIKDAWIKEECEIYLQSINDLGKRPI